MLYQNTNHCHDLISDENTDWQISGTQTRKIMNKINLANIYLSEPSTL